MELLVPSTFPQRIKVLAIARFFKTELNVVVQSSLPEGCIKFPCLKVEDKGYICGSHAIARYLMGNECGLTSFERAQIDEWLQYSTRHLEIPTICAVAPFTDIPLSEVAYTEKQQLSENSIEDLRTKLQVLEKHLSTTTFLVKDRITLADISIVGSIYQAFQYVLSPEERSELVAVTRWVETIMKHEVFLSLCPEFSLCSKPADYSKIEKPVHIPISPLKFPEPDEKPLFSRPRSRVKDLLAASPSSVIGLLVTVCGWARTVRGGAVDRPIFVELNDGSCLSNLQITCLLENLGTASMEKILEAGGIGASFMFQGKVVKSPAKGQEIEIQPTFVRVLGTVADPAHYPLQKSKTAHTLEHLRKYAHLRPRTNMISAVARVRHACAMAVHRFFDARGFTYVHTPIITAADCEGAGQMFQVTTLLEHGFPEPKKDKPKEIDYTQDFFGRPTFLTVSGQLNVECYATALSDVYTFGPTFRAENSNTARHLAEFWMIEPEICFATLQDDMNLAEDFVKTVTREVMSICAEDLKFFDERIEPGLIKRLENVLEEPFERLPYRKAIEILQNVIKQGKVQFEETNLYFGSDLGSEHERYLTEVVFKKPVIVTNYPAAIKAFYMKRSVEDPETVEAMDVLVPRIGELIGGSARETDYDLLDAKMKAMALENDWYMDLRRYGSVPHAGFGLGFERLIMFVTGMTNIRDVIPYPRFPKNAEF